MNFARSELGAKFKEVHFQYLKIFKDCDVQTSWIPFVGRGCPNVLTTFWKISTNLPKLIFKNVSELKNSMLCKAVRFSLTT